MEHARYANVRYVVELALHFGRNIHARKGAADNRIAGRILWFAEPFDIEGETLAGNGQVVAEFALQRENSVGHTFGSITLNADEAIFYLELFEGHCEVAGSETKKQEAGGGGGTAERLRAEHERGAATDAALIYRQGSVAHEEGDTLRRNFQLFSDNLHQSGFDTHANIGLSGEYSNGSVAFDAQPGIEPGGGRGVERFWRFWRSRDAKNVRKSCRTAKTKTDEQAAGIFNELPSGEGILRSHGYPSDLPAARRAALRMRTGPRQRQTKPASAPLISAVVGWAFLWSKAAEVLIQPLRQ